QRSLMDGGGVSCWTDPGAAGAHPGLAWGSEETDMTLNLDQTWQSVLDKVRSWARINSPWVNHFHIGSCHGCDMACLVTLTPRYDVERFGIKLEGSPRHADVLICTGPVTRQARDRLVRIYEQMPEPKFVIAVGSCALSGGAFRGCYNIMGGIDQVIPVDAYVPGCPPRPEAVIDGVVKLLAKLQGKDTSGEPIVIAEPTEDPAAALGQDGEI